MLSLQTKNMSYAKSTYMMTDADIKKEKAAEGAYYMKTRVTITDPPTLYWTVHSDNSNTSFTFKKNGTGYKTKFVSNTVKCTISAIGFSSLSTDGFEFGLASTVKKLKAATANFQYSMYGVAYGGLLGYRENGQLQYTIKDKKGKFVSTKHHATHTSYGF